jgi:hypothetical protein
MCCPRRSGLRRRVEKVVGYPPLVEMDDRQRREFHEALLEADSFEDLPGKNGPERPIPAAKKHSSSSPRPTA